MIYYAIKNENKFIANQMKKLMNIQQKEIEKIRKNEIKKISSYTNCNVLLKMIELENELSLIKFKQILCYSSMLLLNNSRIIRATFFFKIIYNISENQRKSKIIHKSII